MSSASIFVGAWLQRQGHILAWPLYILFKSDGRHRMHCLVFTDTDLYSLTKGKSYLAKQKWRRSTCLQDQCYDVGCHPWISSCWRTHYSNTAKDQTPDLLLQSTPKTMLFFSTRRNLIISPAYQPSLTFNIKHQKLAMIALSVGIIGILTGIKETPQSILLWRTSLVKIRTGKYFYSQSSSTSTNSRRAVVSWLGKSALCTCKLPLEQLV